MTRLVPLLVVVAALVIPDAASAKQRKRARSQTLSEAAFDKVVVANHSDADFCSRHLPPVDELPEGAKVDLQITIARSGAVSNIAVDDHGHGVGEFLGCLLPRIEEWRFPKFKGQRVTYPYTLNVGPSPGESEGNDIASEDAPQDSKPGEVEPAGAEVASASTLDAMLRGGPFMWLILFAVLVGGLTTIAVLVIGVSLRRHARITKAPVLVFLFAFLVAIVPAALGVAGWKLGVGAIEEEVLAGRLDPEAQADIIARSRETAELPLSLGLGASGVLIIPCILSAFLVLTRKTRATDVPEEGSR